jgi:hypothetical protein
MTGDKERERRNEAVLDAIERHTEKHMNDEYGRIHTDGSRSGGQPVTNERLRQSIDQLTKDTAAEWQSGYEAGIEAAANALEDDAKRCDCFAYEENECACGSWQDYKTITSARAVEIVRALQEKDIS